MRRSTITSAGPIRPRRVRKEPEARRPEDYRFIVHIGREIVCGDSGRKWDYSVFIASHPDFLGRFLKNQLPKDELERALRQQFGWSERAQRPAGVSPQTGIPEDEVSRLMGTYDITRRSALNLIQQFPDSMAARDQAARKRYSWQIDAPGRSLGKSE